MNHPQGLCFNYSSLEAELLPLPPIHSITEKLTKGQLSKLSSNTVGDVFLRVWEIIYDLSKASTAT